MTNPTDTNQASEDGLRDLAERYAKDFGIRYDKIRINKKGSITYREHGDSFGGWQESGSSQNLPTWVITKHYDQLKKHELQAEIATNEAWYALGRMIDPREFVAEIGRLELKKQELEKL